VTVTAVEEKNTGERREGQLKLQRSRLKGGRASQGLGEAMGGLSGIGRGWGGLPMVDRGFAGEEHGRRHLSAARGEMRMQERAKWREGELLKVLDQKRRVRGHAQALAMTAVRWRPGGARAEAGWRGARGRRPEERG
jgi:hypothetical protein